MAVVTGGLKRPQKPQSHEKSYYLRSNQDKKSNELWFFNRIKPIPKTASPALRKFNMRENFYCEQKKED